MMVTPVIPATIHVGLDVAKLTLQVDLAGRELALPNTPAGHRSLRAHLRRLQAKTGQAVHVVCEGTGGYERAVVATLQAEDVAASVHNAARVRAFARAQGRLAKTDALDAAVLSAFGAVSLAEGKPCVSVAVKNKAHQNGSEENEQAFDGHSGESPNYTLSEEFARLCG